MRNLDIWRAEYLAFWHLTPGTPEADEAWEKKLALEFGPRRVAPMAFVQKDVCYDSPVDGRPITNKHARLDDLKRNGCVEYDPGMKQDYQRRIADGEKALDRSVEAHVERSISEMPAVKRERLAAELSGGMSADIARITPPQTSREA